MAPEGGNIERVETKDAEGQSAEKKNRQLRKWDDVLEIS